MERISIIEDDRFMREELRYVLEQAGYQVGEILDFSHAVTEVIKENPDLVLLDLSLPMTDGFHICRSLKQSTQIPVLILTSRDGLKDELSALELGADEYLTKPCHGERLLARIRNVLRKTKQPLNLLDGSGFLLDVRSYTVYVGEDSFVLPKNEGRILGELMEHRGELVTKTQLFQLLWGTEEYIDENVLHVTMTRLRKALAEYQLSDRIETVRGKGYCFRT